MLKRYKTVTVIAAILLAGHTFAAPTITGVTAQQRYPWNGTVDITYTVSGDIAATAKQDGLITSLKVSARDGDTGTSYVATSLGGDTSIANGTHKIVWDMEAQGLAFISTNAVFSVSCETAPATYCVIDLSGGTNAASYPVTYLAAPPSGGFNVDAYKTTKLVLKRIEAGTFIMGEDQTDETHRVTLTKPFFIGLFEVTQKQWALVPGSSPYYGFSGDKKPVAGVSYSNIRGSKNGAKWPVSNAVDSSSFLGRLRARTGLDFDLPTEAQWEYACRAGTTTIYSYGNDPNSDYMNVSGPMNWRSIEVGSKLPNPWGLYDMHGNVSEMCLDWYGTLTYGTDPNGNSASSGRVNRNGSYSSGDSTSSYRYIIDPMAVDDDTGFRLTRTIATNAQGSTLCSGVSAPTSIDLTTGTRTAALAEAIRYSTVWETDASGAHAFIAVNSETVNTASGSGAFVWQPARNGTYTLTHKVMNGGTQVGATLTAVFEVSHFPATPVITPTDGTILSGIVNAVISCATDGATIHYTTDGSEPTEESPVYRRFRVSGRMVVKAIAVKDGLCSEVAVAEYALGVCETPSIAAQASFTGSKTQVSISCATDVATIRYTLDGSDPSASSAVYSGAFFVTESCTVKAKAFYPDYFDSAVASFAIEKVWGIGDTLGVPDQSFTTGGDLPFVRVMDATAPLGEAMQSGAITHSQTSTLSTTVSGQGTVSFQWMTSCEDSGGQYDWDHAEFEVDGTAVAKLDGESAWQTFSHDIVDDGTHTLEWRYVKDDVESEGEDCCRVADFRWTPAVSETQTTEVPVPYDWLRDFFPHTPDEYDSYESAALDAAANGVNKVWECYVAGLCPTNALDLFRAVISWNAGVPVISWEPELAPEEAAKRTYRKYGRKSLTDPNENWTEINGDEALFNFFKVSVEMAK